MKNNKRKAWKKRNERKVFREADRVYRLLSKFGFDGFWEYPPSYDLRCKEKMRNMRRKEIRALRKILEEFRKNL